jgi:hypothetical protein
MATSTLGSGTLVLAGTTSGTTTVTATAVAGTTTLTLPAATDTLVGKATTDTLTNKTLTTPSISSPTISDGTANGVAYLNGSKVLTTGSALVFDGTNLGVGTAAPSGYLSGTAKLVVLGNANSQHTALIRNDNTGSSASAALALTASGNTWGIECGSSAKNSNALTFQIDYGVTNSTKMTLDASGNLGIGTTTPANVLDVSGASGVLARFKSTGNYSTVVADNTSTTGGGAFACYKQGAQIGLFGVSGGILGDTSADIAIFAETGSSLKFYTNGSASVKTLIDTSGNLLVGKTATGIGNVGAENLANGAVFSTLVGSTGATSSYNLYSTGAGAYRFYVGMDGTINATSIVITAISDERLKENVRDIDTGLNSIMALKPRRFDWKEGKGQDKKNAAGFIAQEFEDVFPECVSTSKAGADGIEYKNINHETLIPTLVKAIQEQQALITQLTARITALEGA